MMFTLQAVTVQLYAPDGIVRNVEFPLPRDSDKQFDTVLDAIMFAWNRDYRWGFVVVDEQYRVHAVYKAGIEGKYGRLEYIHQV